MNVAVVLAAGRGTRLGGVAKALLVRDGKTFLETIAATAGGELVVVVGAPFADAVGAHARALGARVVVNPDPARGMASSIACGFAALADSPADAAWLWPVDHAAVRGATLARLAAAFPIGNPHAVVRPRYAGRGGHPPLVGRGRWAALAACTSAPDGARSVLRSEDTIDLEVDDPAVVLDVDTPADLAKAAP